MLVDRNRIPEGYDLSDDKRAIIERAIKDYWENANALLAKKHDFFKRKYPNKRWPKQELRYPESVEFFYPECMYEYQLGALCHSDRNGRSRQKKYRLYFNITYINRDFDYYVNRVVPHEIAHAFVEYFYNDKDPQTQKRLSDHNKYWSSFAESLAQTKLSAYLPYKFKPIAPRNWKSAIRKL